MADIGEYLKIIDDFSAEFALVTCLPRDAQGRTPYQAWAAQHEAEQQQIRDRATAMAARIRPGMEKAFRDLATATWSDPAEGDTPQAQHLR